MPSNLVKPPPTLALERACVLAGHGVVAGVDEVGVGALAGPLVAAAVVLPLPRRGMDLDREVACLTRLLGEVRDSKQLKRDQKERLRVLIEAVAAPWVGIGIVEMADLRAIRNQARATQVATGRALAALPGPPDVVLVDGTPTINTAPLPTISVAKVRGGTTSLSIAAASIVASVVHHRLMGAYALLYPEYGFLQHDGHASPAHVAALARYGPSPIHHPYNRAVQAALAARDGLCQRRSGCSSSVETEDTCSPTRPSGTGAGT